jgi:hypothetical protein
MVLGSVMETNPGLLQPGYLRLFTLEFVCGEEIMRGNDMEKSGEDFF